jgi:putative membrane protein
MRGAALRWSPLAVLVSAQIGYPLTAGSGRAALVVATVAVGFAVSLTHAATTRGPRAAVALTVVGVGGGLLVETLALASGVPFGAYGYGDALGPRLLGVPLVIPLAWAWMAWPSWLAAAHLVRGRVARIGVAGLALAAWDLFLDPQMVAEHYWTWHDPDPTLPGVPGVPMSNYLGWLAVAIAIMGIFSVAAGPRSSIVDSRVDAPMLALYLWIYASSVLAHALFLDLPWSALWGGLGMGLVAVPLAAVEWARRPRRTT